MVLEKKKLCPKDQFCSPAVFFAADTPRLLAVMISTMRSSRAESAGERRTSERE